ncbi:redoxin domain-containing protein [Nostoc sp. CALU 546]|uniref:redoxin domain-containing protein n=1 Tax=Nostoc sp. CALU 546 TaxID=1867241 RepID=UPI003B679097
MAKPRDLGAFALKAKATAGLIYSWQVPKDKLAAIVQATEELRQSEILKNSLNLGDRVKDFTLPNVSGNAVELKQLLVTGPVVISFFRGTWCRFCNLELKALQDVLPEIQALGASLVAILPQIPDYYSM